MAGETSTRLQALVQELSQAAAEREVWEELEQIRESAYRITPRLDEEAYFQLDQLADRLDQTVTGLAQRLLTAAIRDAWEAAEMPEVHDQQLRERYIQFRLERENLARRAKGLPPVRYVDGVWRVEKP